MSTKFKALTIKNFISAEDAKMLVDFATGIEPWEYGGSDFWDNRSLNAINIYNNHSKDMGRYLYELRARIAKEIELGYQVEKIYPDLTQIVRWYPGQEQHPHADDMTDVEGTDWFHHRDFGAIIYLNDGYTGGETYYPDYGVSIKPEVGMLAIHPGDTDHMHGVTRVEGGMRYTIASFWTRDSEYFDNWKIH
jgi:hypothetical protein